MLDGAVDRGRRARVAGRADRVSIAWPRSAASRLLRLGITLLLQRTKFLAVWSRGTSGPVFGDPAHRVT